MTKKEIDSLVGFKYSGHVERVSGMRNIYKMLFRIARRKGPQRKPGRKVEDNIKVNLGEIWWTELAQDRVQSADYHQHGADV
jgi:hypothetical protein